VQSRAVVTVKDASAPPDGAAPESVFATVTSQRVDVGAVTEMFEEARPQDSAHHESKHATNSRARIARKHTASRLPLDYRGNG
jgi:hypothetical protein